MWLDFSHDTKQKLKVTGDGLADTLQVLAAKLQLHVVEIIGNPTHPTRPALQRSERTSHGVSPSSSSSFAGMEGIVACQLLQNQPCLLHCRLQAGALAVWLRSPVPELPDCLIYHCQRALSEH